MEFTKISPIKYDVKVTPGSTIKCEFGTKGSKKSIKLNVALHIYYKHQVRSNMVDTVSSDIHSVYTDKNSIDHKIEIKVPEFKDCTQSFITIQIDNSADVYEKVYLEYINVDVGHLENIGPQQLQGSQQTVDNLSLSRQSLADQLRASTIVPNIQPKICESTDQFSQNSVLRNTYMRNMPIQDVQPRGFQYIDQKTSKKQSIECIENVRDKIVFISTWGINCGIATYTMYLTNELNKIFNDKFAVNPTNKGSLHRYIGGKLVHIQHEYGIIPTIPNTKDKVIITWHTVQSSISSTMSQFESRLNVVAHIIHCEKALEYVNTEKDVYVISHGSVLIPEIEKEHAKELLGISIKKPIGFVFGFQSNDKNYNRIIEAAKNTGIHLIISGAKHDSGFSLSLPNNENVTFLDRYLTEPEVSLYALASDLLLFDYIEQIHYSVSGAMHRIIGAGRPVICSDIKHFSDINIAQKFKNQKELEDAIIYSLENQNTLGNLSLKYAKDTSWEKVAKRHMEVYRKYVDI